MLSPLEKREEIKAELKAKASGFKFEPTGDPQTRYYYSEERLDELADVLLTRIEKSLEAAKHQAYKDGARDVRDFSSAELMKRAGTLRDDINIFTFDQTLNPTNHD